MPRNMNRIDKKKEKRKKRKKAKAQLSKQVIVENGSNTNVRPKIAEDTGVCQN